jgi:hemoglobin-like flavoprotein
MTPREVQLIQATYPSLRPIGDQAVALFFARLFELDPSLRPLFHGERSRHGRQLIDLLGHVVRHLDEAGPRLAQAFSDAARECSARLQADHYVTIGTALLWTLRQVLGAGFSAEVESAWAALYRRLSGEIHEGAATNRAA